MLSPGTMLGDRYRLDSRIASGGMGDVWKATDSVLGRTVAVKVLLPSLMEDPGFAERFRAEARVVATLSHHNVVHVYDYGESGLDGGGKAAYLVMEFIEGKALSKILQDEGRLSGARTMALIAQAAEALHEAHKAGVIHRDVKPGNLLVRPNGTLLLTDFGIARSAQSTNLTMAGSIMGTAAYISPEQANGLPATPLSDLYGLGVVAYQCMAGRRPWDSDNPLELAMKHARETPPPLPQDVPPPVAAVIHRAMEKDPGRRFQSGEEFAAAARAAAGEQATTAVPAGAPGPLSAGTLPLPTVDPGPAGVGGRGAPPDGGPKATVSAPRGRGLDDDATKVGVPLPPKQPSKRVGLYAMIGAGVLALVLILGGLAIALANSGGNDGDATGDNGGGPAASESTGDNGDNTDGITLDPNTYAGRPWQEVKQELEAMDLVVRFEGIGRFVATLTPTSGLQPGDTVTITRTNVPGGGTQSGDPDPGQSGTDPSCTPTIFKPC